MNTNTRWRALNQAALLLALGLFAALGLAWWRDRTRQYEQPRWDAARFVALSPAVASASDEHWLVVANLRCPHCLEHMHALADSLRMRERPVALGVLLVDQLTRPEGLDLGVPLPGGVWWDSTQVWRESWGRRVYGETFRFDADGRLLSATPAGEVPDSSSSRM